MTDWVARLEKLEQALAAESDSGLLVQPAWIEKNVPDLETFAHHHPLRMNILLHRDRIGRRNSADDS